MLNFPEEQHNIEIQQNLSYWEKKIVLKKIYKSFYNLIIENVNFSLDGLIVEIGSGIGNLKSVIPQALCTDIFQNPWIDQVENAYNLSFTKETISNLILFDVWHHLQYPGNALNEFKRVLKPNGRIIIFDPDISLLSFIVYGLFHHEPIGYRKKIKWFAPSHLNYKDFAYYAAQGNANRIFCSNKYDKLLSNWKRIHVKHITSVSYIASGGYSKPQLYPKCFLPFMNFIDHLLSKFPLLFATRLLVVLEKKPYRI